MAKVIERVDLTEEEMNALALVYEMFIDLIESADDTHLYTACCNIAQDLEAFRQEWVYD